MNIKKKTKKWMVQLHTLFFLPLFSWWSSCELRWWWLGVGNRIVGVSSQIGEDHGVVMWQEKQGGAITNCHKLSHLHDEQCRRVSNSDLWPIAVKTCTHVQVLTGMGAGCLEKPQGSPWYSLTSSSSLIKGRTTRKIFSPSQNSNTTTMFIPWPRMSPSF